MKSKPILLLLGLLISSSFAFGQVPIDTLRKDSILPQLKSYFSAEQSWKKSKEAYKSQLEAKGLSEDEIKQKILEFEKKKPAIIERINKQLKLVEKQMELSGIQRKTAEEELQRFIKQWGSGEFERQMADLQRSTAELQQKIGKEYSTSTKSIFNKSITISGNNSKTKIVKVKVTKSNTLFFNVSGEINSGNVLIEILDPKGQKQGELSLEHHKSSTRKTGQIFSNKNSGSVNNINDAPETGDWVVKITPNKSNGHIHISVAQYTKPMK